MSKKFIKIHLPENMTDAKGLLLCVQINEYLTNVWGMKGTTISVHNEPVPLTRKAADAYEELKLTGDIHA